MLTRILSALVMIIVLGVPVIFGPAWVFLAFAMIGGPWCVYELMKAILPRSAMILGYILMAGTEGLFWYAYKGDFLMISIVSAVAALTIIIVGLYLFERDKAKASDIALAVSGLIYPAGLLAFWILVRNAADGRFWIILGLTCTFIADGGAYFAGRYLGRHKISPRLSPKKTLEGVIGGIAASVLFGVFFGMFYPKLSQTTTLLEPFLKSYPLWLYAVLGIAVALLDLAGDLMASMIKREYGIKDFGNVIPGHGGLLDRADGIIPVGAALYIIISFLIS
jgi:phosphatidate cytidylyltransferase